MMSVAMITQLGGSIKLQPDLASNILSIISCRITQKEDGVLENTRQTSKSQRSAIFPIHFHAHN